MARTEYTVEQATRVLANELDPDKVAGVMFQHLTTYRSGSGDWASFRNYLEKPHDVRSSGSNLNGTALLTAISAANSLLLWEQLVLLSPAADLNIKKKEANKPISVTPEMLANEVRIRALGYSISNLVFSLGALMGPEVYQVFSTEGIWHVDNRYMYVGQRFHTAAADFPQLLTRLQQLYPNQYEAIQQSGSAYNHLRQERAFVQHHIPFDRIGPTKHNWCPAATRAEDTIDFVQGLHKGIGMALRDQPYIDKLQAKVEEK